MCGTHDSDLGVSNLSLKHLHRQPGEDMAEIGQAMSEEHRRAHAFLKAVVARHQ